MVNLGTLLVRVKAVKLLQNTKRVGDFQKKFTGMAKKLKPQLAELNKGFKKMGIVAGGTLVALTRASPLLQARFEILTLRVEEFLRVFGDALAPVIEQITDLVVQATDIWDGLSPALQQAILFGTNVAIVIGVLAGAFFVLNLAMSPITLILLAIGAAAALLFLAWETNFLGIQDIVMGVFEAVGPILEDIGVFIGDLMTIIGAIIPLVTPIFDVLVGIFESAIGTIMGLVGNWIQVIVDVMDIIGSLLSGDMEGALAGVEKLFEDLVVAVLSQLLAIPLFFNNLITDLGGTLLTDIQAGIQGFISGFIQPILDFFSGDVIAKIAAAGEALILAFIQGMQAAIAAAGQVINDILDFIAGFFGGSLPERGPLVNIVQKGSDLAQGYIQGIDQGLSETRIGDVISNNFRIDNINLELPDSSLDRTTSFLDRLGGGVRRATT